ncbi:hypothetical protein [Chitinophaga sp.]|nr:hypothetical protein [uncultured Chitinophaga sp.]
MLPDAKIHLLLAQQIPGLRNEASGAPVKSLLPVSLQNVRRQFILNNSQC